MRAIGCGLLVELAAMEKKIMKRKGILKEIEIWIEYDLTERE